jgi:hypothetical protein
MSQILNRISLGLAKHERILKTLKRPAPSASSTSQSKSSTSGFSSLAQSTAAADKPVSNGIVSKSREEEDRLFEQDRALPPNAGIGFVEERKAGERVGKGKEEKMLRGRLLGKRGEGKDKGGERKRYVDESEEEEGRSGLGKKKRKVGRIAVEDINGVAGDGGEGVGGTVSEDVATAAQESPPVVEDTTTEKRDDTEESGGRSDGEEQANGAVRNTGEVGVVDAAEQAKAKKRKRKQAKKKRSKANKAQGEETPVERPEQAAPRIDE